MIPTMETPATKEERRARVEAARLSREPSPFGKWARWTERKMEETRLERDTRRETFRAAFGMIRAELELQGDEYREMRDNEEASPMEEAFWAGAMYACAEFAERV